jgi:hypothetical protein
MTDPSHPEARLRPHLGWVRTRLTLESDLRETTSRGFALIAAGFGSFAIFDGLAFGEHRVELPLTFALVATAIGIAVIFLGIVHYRKMAAWVDDDEFGSTEAPKLPNELRSILISVVAMGIGLISFIALLLIR